MSALPDADWYRHHFHVMGTIAEVLVPPGTAPGAVDRAVARAEDLEARWSRFRACSELSLLNRAGRAQVSVSTAELIEIAFGAYRRTGGLFDPTVHDALVALGYDRDFGLLRHGARSAAPPVSRSVGDAGPAPGMDGVYVAGGVVELPAGVHLDLGGIGKGRCADLVAAGLRADGVPAALVSVGGDLACYGGADAPFPLQVEHPELPASVIARLTLTEGALVTSAPAARRWAGGHHIIDPRTGAPTRSGVVQVSVVAASAAWAEAIGKAALVAGADDGLALLVDCGLDGLVCSDDGTLQATAGWPRYCTEGSAVFVAG